MFKSIYILSFDVNDAILLKLESPGRGVNSLLLRCK